MLNPEKDEVKKTLALAYMGEKDQGPDLYALNLNHESKEAKKAH